MSIATKISIVGFALFSTLNLVTGDGFWLAAMWGGIVALNHLGDRLKAALVEVDKGEP